MPESLKSIRQRVQWGLARATSAVVDFGGDPASPPVTSTLGHLQIAYRELSAWIDAGVSDFPVAEPPPAPVGQVATPTFDPPSGTY